MHAASVCLALYMNMAAHTRTYTLTPLHTPIHLHTPCTPTHTHARTLSLLLCAYPGLGGLEDARGRGGGAGGQWDQFETNRKLFGVQTTYREEVCPGVTLT
jgi:hypothetical protein